MMRKLVAVLSSLLVLGGAANAEGPAVGTVAPGFSLSDQNGATRRLAEWRGRWVVLFYQSVDTSRHSAEIVADLKLLQGRAAGR